MAIPQYLQVVDYFRDLIDSGSLQPGEKMPTNRQVGEIFGFSKETVSKASRHLQHLGYCYTTREGTFVRDGQRTGEGEARQEKITAVLEAWTSVGAIGPAWSIRWDGRDGAYRVAFTVFQTWGPEPRHHNFSEAEFEIYATALAEWIPDEAGQAAVALALGWEEDPR